MIVVWAPRARRQALGAARYIAKENPVTAVRWLEELFEHVGQLNRLPRRGRPGKSSVDDSIRELLHGPYRVIYRVDSTMVRVLAVRHARRAG